MRQNFSLIPEPQSPLQLRKLFDHFRFHGGLHGYGRVKTHGPSSVTAITCSKCAE